MQTELKALREKLQHPQFRKSEFARGLTLYAVEEGSCEEVRLLVCNTGIDIGIESFEARAELKLSFDSKEDSPSSPGERSPESLSNDGDVAHGEENESEASDTSEDQKSSPAVLKVEVLLHASARRCHCIVKFVLCYHLVRLHSLLNMSTRKRLSRHRQNMVLRANEVGTTRLHQAMARRPRTRPHLYSRHLIQRQASLLANSTESDFSL